MKKPKIKTGTWEWDDGWFCSECGFRVPTVAGYRWCPHCMSRNEKKTSFYDWLVRKHLTSDTTYGQLARMAVADPDFPVNGTEYDAEIHLRMNNASMEMIDACMQCGIEYRRGHAF